MLNDEQLAKKNFRAVEDFIQFRAKSEDLVRRVFGVAENKIVRLAFEKILNVDSNIIAEYLAKFLDYHLKKSQQDEAQMEKITKEVVGLFKWCYAKDVFQEFYLRGLSRRLLLKKSASTDSERAMIARLRPECGTDFSQRSDAMIKDFSDSNNLNSEYKHIHKDKEGDLES